MGKIKKLCCHAILSSAAVSQVAVHAAVLVSEEGFPLMHGCYKHG